MRIILASSVSLLASLLLFFPADVSCQRHARAKNGDHGRQHDRRRSTTEQLYFTGSNLRKVCGICHHKYDINLENCMSGKREAKYKCMLIARDNPQYFESKMATVNTPSPAKHRRRHSVKRSATLRAFFEGPNLAKVCEICRTDYNIDAEDCVNGRHFAKLKCMQKVKKIRLVFDSKMAELDTPPPPPPSPPDVTSVNVHVPTGDEYFTPENLPKTCQVCGVFKVNSAECLSTDGEARKNCRIMVNEMPNTVAKQWKKVPSKSANVHVPTGDEYFTQENLPKTCQVCGVFKVNSVECLSTDGEARKNCRNMVNEMPNTVAKQWKKIPEMSVQFLSIVGKRSAAKTEDIFKGEDLPMTCEICHIYYAVDDVDCIEDRKTAREECRRRVKEHPEHFEFHWNKPISPAEELESVNLGTVENVRKICQYCSEQLNYDLDDCLAARNGTQQNCRKWIKGTEKAIENLLNGQSKPNVSESTQERQWYS